MNPHFASLGQLGTLPDNTTISSQGASGYYGPFSKEQLVRESTEYIAKNSNAKVSEVEPILKAFLSIAQQDCERIEGTTDATWLDVRMTKPSAEYRDYPRWHRDGCMYTVDREDLIHSKYAITLLGRGTRVLGESELVSEVLTDGMCDDQRVEIAEKLMGEKVVHVKGGEVIRFSWGEDRSAVHSEPDFDSDRIFVSILFGSEKEIRDRCDLSETKYGEWDE